MDNIKKIVEHQNRLFLILFNINKEIMLEITINFIWEQDQQNSQEFKILKSINTDGLF